MELTNAFLTWMQFRLSILRLFCLLFICYFCFCCIDADCLTFRDRLALCAVHSKIDAAVVYVRLSRTCSITHMLTYSFGIYTLSEQLGCAPINKLRSHLIGFGSLN